MIKFFNAAQKDLAEDWLEERKLEYPTTTMKIIEVSGILRQGCHTWTKEKGGYVITTRQAYEYENELYKAWGMSPAAKREFDQL